MKKLFIVLFFAFVICLAGCAMLNKIAPSQNDVEGNPLPGTHELIQPVKDVTDAIPYGGVATSVLLLVWNFLEKAKANKTTAGLMSTIRAIEAASKDPEIKDAIAKLKIKLAESHQTANVTPLIKQLLSKIKFG